MGFIYLLSLKVLKIFPPLWRKGTLKILHLLLTTFIEAFIWISLEEEKAGYASR